jgi:hypothetical protein
LRRSRSEHDILHRIVGRWLGGRRDRGSGALSDGMARRAWYDANPIKEDLLMIATPPPPVQPKRLSLPVCSHAPQPYNGPAKSEVIALRQQYLSPGLLRYYKEPLMVVEGHMQYLWDETGNVCWQGQGRHADI